MAVFGQLCHKGEINARQTSDLFSARAHKPLIQNNMSSLSPHHNSSLESCSLSCCYTSPSQFCSPHRHCITLVSSSNMHFVCLHNFNLVYQNITLLIRVLIRLHVETRSIHAWLFNGENELSEVGFNLGM